MLSGPSLKTGVNTRSFVYIVAVASKVRMRDKKKSTYRTRSIIQRNWTRLFHLLHGVEPPGGEVAHHMRYVVRIGLANLLHL